MELQRPRLLDSAVQESMLAIPYALAKLDAISQAADHYLNAIEAFYEEIRIDRTIGSSRARFSTSFSRTTRSTAPAGTGAWRNCPKVRKARYLFHLLATHEFQEGLKNYRDLQLLPEPGCWQQSVDVYANMLETRMEAYEERLPRIEAALARADLDGMVDRKLEFDSVLNDIEQSNDWLALATEVEFEMWGEITSSKHPGAGGGHSGSRGSARQDQVVEGRAAVGAGARIPRSPLAHTQRLA